MTLEPTVGSTLRPFVDQLLRWGTQSPDRLALLIGAALVALVVGLVVSFRLGRWLGRTVLRLSIWLAATAWDVSADAVHRWRAPGGSTGPQDTAGIDSAPGGESQAAGGREYLRIRPTSETYAPETLATALHGLQSTQHRTEVGPNWREPQADVLEMFAATRGGDAGVEFYVGGTMPLDRLASALPYRQCGFDIDRVQAHPAHLLDPRVADDRDAGTPVDASSSTDRSVEESPVPETAADGGSVEATEVDATGEAPADAPSADPTAALLDDLTDRGREPVVYRLTTHGRRRKDWMMGRPGFTDVFDTAGDGGSPAAGKAAHPQVPMIETLDAMECPALFHVSWRSFRAWGAQADMREYKITTRRDTVGQKVADFLDDLLGSFEVEQRHRRDTRRQGSGRHTHTRDRHASLSRTTRKRLDHLDETDPDNTVVANAAFAAIPTKEQSRANVASAVRALWENLDHLDGDYYHLDAPPSPAAERLTGLLNVRGARHRQRLRRLCRRRVTTPVLGHTRFNLRKRWPDLVCTPDELAAVTSIPSTAWLPSRLTSAVEHEPGHSRPLTQVSPSVRDRYVGWDVEGRTAGYLFTPDGEPDLERPFRLPVGDLQTHGLRQGLPNCGKTTDMARDVVDDHRATAGPTIMFTGPGGDLGDFTMRAVAAEEGLDHLREHVHWFRIPVVQPGLTFFDIRHVQSAPDVRGWADAAGDVADKYLRVAEALMGREAFQRAPLATDTLRALIAAGFDPGCYPPAPDDDTLVMPHREQESAGVYRFWQLEAQAAAIATLTRTMSHQEYLDVDARLPDVQHPRLARNLHTPFTFEQRTAANVIGGVQTRLRAVSNNLRLAALFDNTVERFGFHTILEGSDADDIFIFDLGALTTVSQRAYAITLLSLLDLQIKTRQAFLEHEAPADYLVTVHVDEAAQLVDTPEFGEFLDVIRNYTVGVNLTLQYPEQLRQRGGERTYESVLSNVQTTILGPGAPSDDQAGHLLPDDWDVTEFKARLRDLPETHRLVLVRPQEAQSRPQVFELHRGPLPEWHPDATTGPFADPSFRETYEAAIADVKERTQAEYGIPDGESEREIRERRELGVPEVTDAIGLARDNLAAFLALMARHAQQAAAVDTAAQAGANATDGPDVPAAASGDGAADGDLDGHGGAAAAADADTPDASPWVPVSEIYARFMTQIDVAITNVDTDEAVATTETLPDHEAVATCVAESPYFETALTDEVAASAPTAAAPQEDDLTASVLVRLTADGQEVATDLDDPGEGVTAGSAAHTAMLQTVQRALQQAGAIELNLVTQDGSAASDAVGGYRRAVDGAEETVPLTVEAEQSSSTVSHPTKPLQNLKKAQEAAAVALFAVPTGDLDTGDDVTTYAERLAGILADPINRLRSEPRYYVHDDRRLTFHGGARNGGETVVRRRTGDDTGRTIWVAAEGAAELRAPDAEVLTTIDDPDAAFDEAQLEQFPAYYTYDPRTQQYTVHEHGAHHQYDDPDDMEADWVTVKEPFIPERELPVPDYTAATYAILLVHDSDEAMRQDAASGGAAETAVSLFVEDDAGAVVNRQT